MGFPNPKKTLIVDDTDKPHIMFKGKVLNFKSHVIIYN